MPLNGTSLAEVLRQCAELVRSGMPLDRAARLASIDQPALQGEAAAGASDPSGWFPAAMQNTRRLMAGLPADRGAEVFHAAADALEARQQRAPGWIVLVVTVAVAVVMVVVYATFVAPSLDQIASGFSVVSDNPISPKLTLRVAQWIVIPAFLLVVAALVLRRTLNGLPRPLGPAAARLERIFSRVPLIEGVGRVARTKVMARWLAATRGIDTMAARLESLAELGGEARLRREAQQAAVAVRGGKPLADAFVGTAWLPGLAALLRDHPGDPQGEVDGASESLRAYSAALDLRADDQLARVVLVAQLVVGVLVGLMVVSMYMPIFLVAAMM
jgi:type II secretory pathway component PulF